METHPLSPLLLDELVIEILSRLPIKSLVRFRCVSKSWYSLIFNPRFNQLYKSPPHSQNNPNSNNDFILLLQNYHLAPDYDTIVIPCSIHSLLHNYSNNPSRLISIPEDGCRQLEPTEYPLGSCNGLVCFRITQLLTKTTETLCVRFWNPVLRLLSKKSPTLRIVHSDDTWSGTGLGYDSLNDTFKVIALISASQKITVKFYTMGDDRWRDVLSLPAFPFLAQRNGQFVDGTVNWLALDKSGSAYEWGAVTVNQLLIFAFDLGEETYKQLLLPSAFDELPSDEPSLAVLRDCLCLFYCHRGTHLVIWQMQEFGVENSWTQFINVSYQHLQFEIGDPHYTPPPLCTSEDGDVVMLANNKDYEAIIYDQKHNRVEHTSIPNGSQWMDGMDYVQSLVLPR